jgi:hypothetical protein
MAKFRQLSDRRLDEDIATMPYSNPSPKGIPIDRERWYGSLKNTLTRSRRQG